MQYNYIQITTLFPGVCVLHAHTANILYTLGNLETLIFTFSYDRLEI